eukprot:364198-Chlamydomonas_euryale.AAC.7
MPMEQLHPRHTQQLPSTPPATQLQKCTLHEYHQQQRQQAEHVSSSHGDSGNGRRGNGSGGNGRGSNGGVGLRDIGSSAGSRWTLSGPLGSASAAAGTAAAAALSAAPEQTAIDPDPRLLVTFCGQLPYHLAARGGGGAALAEWLDPAVPLEMLLATWREGDSGGAVPALPR